MASAMVTSSYDASNNPVAVRQVPVQVTKVRSETDKVETQGKPTMQGRIDVASLTANNLGQLRRLNAALFPVRFGERWYKDVLKEEVSDICKFGLFNDIPVANICCRFEPIADAGAKADQVRVYIMTLGCLAPYRRMGISSTLLRHVLAVAGPGHAVQLPASFGRAEGEAVKSNASTLASTKAAANKDTKAKATKRGEVSSVPRFVESVYLHVQTGNEEAKSFYLAHGFTVEEHLDEYYKAGIAPRSAWLLRLR